MPKAASKIIHGALDKAGKNVVLTFEPGEEVTGLPKDVMEALAAIKAIEPSNADEAAAKAAADNAGAGGQQ